MTSGLGALAIALDVWLFHFKLESNSPHGSFLAMPIFPFDWGRTWEITSLAWELCGVLVMEIVLRRKEIQCDYRQHRSG